MQIPVRHLNLQEYQSKQLMSDNGIFVQNFRIASSRDEAEEISHSFRKHHTLYILCITV